MILRFGLVLVMLGCSTEPQPAPIDPFDGESLAFVLEQPARAFAVTEPVGFVFTLELSDELMLANLDAMSIVEGATIAVGQGPRDVVAFDVDQDGSLDLTSADTSGSTLSLIENSSGPAVQLPATHPPKHLAVADFDRDGWADLLVSAGLGAESRVLVWQNTSGTLAPTGTSLPVAGADRCRAGDLDGDGAADAVIALSSQNQLAILENGGDGSLALAHSLDVCETPIAARLGDLDASGTADVVIACKGEALLLLDPARGEERVSLPGGTQLYDVAVADFDEDGALDVAAIDVGEHTLRVSLAPLSHSAVTGVHPVARGPIRLEALDVEKDGDVDLAILAYEQRSLQVLLNQRR